MVYWLIRRDQGHSSIQDLITGQANLPNSLSFAFPMQVSRV